MREVSGLIGGINASAPVVFTEQAQVDLGSALGTEAFDLPRILAMDPAIRRRTGHRHDPGVGPFGSDPIGELDPDQVARWLRDLPARHGADIFRAEGVPAPADHECSWVVQGVHHLLDTEPRRPWPTGAPRRSRLMFVGRDLDRERPEVGLRSCLVGVG